MNGTEAAALDRRVRDLIATLDIDEPREADFTEVAIAMFRFQYAQCDPYRRYCEAMGASPETVTRWPDVPAVPTSAFKTTHLTTCDKTTYQFRTSGTSDAVRAGTVTRDAEAQALVWDAQVAIHAAMMRPDSARLPLFSLVPTPDQWPDASIAHSVATLMHRNGAPGSRSFVGHSGLDHDGLYRALLDLEARGEPVELYGATYSFVPFLDWLRRQARRVRLPDGSRLAHGSGYKGRSRELSARDFHDYVADRLGIPAQRNVDVLGMTELGSQFYDDVLRRPGGSRSASRRLTTHPWTRTRVVDPDTLADQPPGVPGFLVHYDLSLRGNVLAVLTEDLGASMEGGFRILGRAHHAEPRGCNAAMEALLTGHASARPS
jgi:hypothetical protein